MFGWLGGWARFFGVRSGRNSSRIELSQDHLITVTVRKYEVILRILFKVHMSNLLDNVSKGHLSVNLDYLASNLFELIFK